MTRPSRSFHVPFLEQRNELRSLFQLGVPRDDYITKIYRESFVWKAAEPFPLESLQLMRYRHEISSKYFEWQDPNTGFYYPMFEADIVQAVRIGAEPGGVVKDVMWEIIKQGTKYGIRIYQEIN